MAHQISRSSPHLRFLLDTSRTTHTSPLIPSRRIPRRTFTASTRHHARTRTNVRQDQPPARPSMATAQAMQAKSMRRQDLPEEMGMLRITYILPPGPSIFKDPSLRSSQLKEHIVQWWKEGVQALATKFFFWRGIPLRIRPPHLKKYPLFKSPRINLQTLHHARIAKDLHKRSYEAIQHAVETGDFKPIRETCGKSLQDHYTRLVNGYANKREVVKWQATYSPLGAVKILSRKFGQVPIPIDNIPVGQQQVVARVTSSQTLTSGTVTGRSAKDGRLEISWGTPKTRKVVEHVIMSRKYIAGRFEEWKIFGFQSPKGTREELEKWREVQDEIPSVGAAR